MRRERSDQLPPRPTLQDYEACFQYQDPKQAADAVETGVRIAEGLWSLRDKGVKMLSWRNGPMLFEYRGLKLYARIVAEHGRYLNEWGMWTGELGKNIALAEYLSLRQRLDSADFLSDPLGFLERLRDTCLNGSDATRRADRTRELRLDPFIKPSAYVLFDLIVVDYDTSPPVGVSAGIPILLVGVRSRVMVRVLAWGKNVPRSVRIRQVNFHKGDFRYTRASRSNTLFEVILHRTGDEEWEGFSSPIEVVVPEPGVYMVGVESTDWSPRWAMFQRMLDGRTLGRAWSETCSANCWHLPLIALDPMGTQQVELNRRILTLTYLSASLGIGSIGATVWTRNEGWGLAVFAAGALIAVGGSLGHLARARRRARDQDRALGPAPADQVMLRMEKRG